MPAVLARRNKAPWLPIAYLFCMQHKAPKGGSPILGQTPRYVSDPARRRPCHQSISSPSFWGSSAQARAGTPTRVPADSMMSAPVIPTCPLTLDTGPTFQSLPSESSVLSAFSPSAPPLKPIFLPSLSTYIQVSPAMTRCHRASPGSGPGSVPFTLHPDFQLQPAASDISSWRGLPSWRAPVYVQARRACVTSETSPSALSVQKRLHSCAWRECRNFPSRLRKVCLEEDLLWAQGLGLRELMGGTQAHISAYGHATELAFPMAPPSWPGSLWVQHKRFWLAIGHFSRDITLGCNGKSGAQARGHTHTQEVRCGNVCVASRGPVCFCLSWLNTWHAVLEDYRRRMGTESCLGCGMGTWVVVRRVTVA